MNLFDKNKARYYYVVLQTSGHFYEYLVMY